MSYIGNQVPTGSYRKLSDISASFNGVTTTFQLSVPPGTVQYYVTPRSTFQLLISVGGVIQEPDVDFTLNGSQIIFSTAPAAGLSFFGIQMGDALNVGTPSDGTVTDAKVSNSAAISSAKLAFTQTGTGAVARTVDSKLKETVSVKDFGAVGNGVADDTAAIQAAIDAVGIAGGGIVWLPPGTYKVSATLVVNRNFVSIVGSGMWDTTLTRNTDYGDTLLLTGNDTTGVYVSGLEVKNLRFTSTGLTTSGSHINANGVSRLTITQVFMFDGFIGLTLNGVLPAFINDLYIVFVNLFAGSATGRRYVTIGNAAVTYSHPSCADVFIHNFDFTGNQTFQAVDVGLEILSADGIWFSNGRVAWTTAVSLLLNAATSEDLSLVWFGNFMLDATIGDGMRFTGTATAPKAFGNIRFSNFNFKGGTVGQNAILYSTGTNVTDVHYSNGQIWQWDLHGIHHQSADTGIVSYDNVHAFDCGLLSTGVYSAFQTANNVSNIKITGGRYGGRAAVGASGLTRFGINIATGTGSNILIQGADCRNNTERGISFGATGTNNVVANCIDSFSRTVASAGSISPAIAHDLIFISGTATISTIVARPAGTSLVMIFQSTATVDETGNIKLAGTFVATADDVLTLVCDGTNWYEVSRSVN